MTAVGVASVLVAVLVDPGPKGAWAEDVVFEGGLTAPELVLAETGNVLRRLEQAGVISRLEANSAYDDLRRVVRGARRGARLPARDARPQAQPRPRPGLRGHHPAWFVEIWWSDA